MKLYLSFISNINAENFLILQMYVMLICLGGGGDNSDDKLMIKPLWARQLFSNNVYAYIINIFLS